MSAVISESTINKLNYKIKEIRLRALKEVENKLLRHNEFGEDLLLNVHSLYNALIVGLKDRSNNAQDYLDVIYILFKSDFSKELLNLLGVSRISKDIESSISPLESNPLVTVKVKDLLEYIGRFKNNDSFVNAFENFRLSNKDTIDETHFGLNVSPSDYIKCWQRPHISDLKEIKDVKHSLAERHNDENLEHALFFVKGAVKNLPAEYFLQPPYLYKSLFDCLEVKVFETDVLKILTDLTKALQSRYKLRTLTRTIEFTHLNTELADELPLCQISIPAYCYQLFMVMMDSFKELDDHSYQMKLNEYFKLMNEIVGLLRLCPTKNEYQPILRELTFFAQFYRENYQKTSRNFSCRVNYLIVLQMIASLAYHLLSNKEDDCIVVDDHDYEADKPIWKKELEISLLDFSIRHTNPELYDAIYQICKTDENHQLNVIIHCDEILSPAVELLRYPNKYDDKELLRLGLLSVQTLKVHKSTELVEKLMTAINKCELFYEGDVDLTETAEMLTLRLLAINTSNLKILAYKMASNSVKSFFSGLSDGSSSSRLSNFKPSFIGIPVNENILTEIICFGLKHQNNEISSCAETIIAYFVRGKPLLGKHWKTLLELLFPLMPLLQAVVDRNSSLQSAVFKLMDPDLRLSLLECMQGNVRYLFSMDAKIREEAIIRLLFITVNHTQSEHYLPNMEHIKDTISDKMCIVRHPLPLRNPLRSGVYDTQTLHDLIQLLACKDAAPSGRHSTLVQLNGLVDDPTLCDVLYRQNSWPYILQAFDNAMRFDHTKDYPESAIPAVQIICKLCIRIPELRRNMAHDPDFNFLLLRAMFMYHSDEAFKTDAATLLFILSHSEFILGTDDISVPHAFSDLWIPFQCEFHYSISPFYQASPLEEIFQEESEEAYNDLLIVIDDNVSPTKQRRRSECGVEHLKEMKATQNGFDQNRNTRKNKNVPNQEQWQYLRMVFTTLWFDGLEFLLQNVERTIENSLNGTKDRIVDYKSLPVHLSTVEEGQIDLSENILDFNKKLELLNEDLDLIRITSSKDIIKNSIRLIENSTSHKEAVTGVCGLKSITFLPQQHEFCANDIINAIKRFIITPPATDDDEMLFILVIDLVQSLIKTGYDNILVWILTQISDSNSIFIKLLRDKDNITPKLYQHNISLLRTIIKISGSTENPDVLNLLYNEAEYHIKKENGDSIALTIFEILAEELIECDKTRIHSILSLLRCLTMHLKIETDEVLLNNVVNSLFYCLTGVRSMVQFGSYITKCCLFTIGNLMQLFSEPMVEQKYLRLLQALCGHTDSVVRAAAWSVLSIIAGGSLKGAQLIVKELAYLPGGIHACVLQSLLDVEESSLVKGATASLFVKLLQYKTDKGLHEQVWPTCKKKQVQSNVTGFDLLCEIINKQQLLEKTSAALKVFNPKLYHDPDQEIQFMTPPGTVIHFCNVFISIFDVRVQHSFSDSELVLLDSFIRCVTLVKSNNLNPTTLCMAAEICKLISRYLSKDDTLLSIVLHNPNFMVFVLELLNIDIYETSETLKTTSISILQLIKTVANIKEGYEFICYCLDKIHLEKMLEYLNVTLLEHQNSELLVAVLDCITVLLLNADIVLKNAIPFNVIVDNITIDDFKPLEVIENQEDEETNLQPASVLLMRRIISLYKFICEKDKPKNGVLYSSSVKHSCYNAMQVLLRNTEQAKKVASEQQLFDKIMERFEVIHTGIGMNCTEFIRKYGDRKKESIVAEFQALVSIMCSWFERSTLLNEYQIDVLIRRFIILTSWIKADVMLERVFFTSLVFISEDSLPVCKALALTPHGCSTSLLKVVSDLVKVESSKPKATKTNIELLRTGLRVLINCCSSIEGRNHIAKLNVLETINKLHPSVTKLQPAWNKITEHWLTFWEIYSRYPEGATFKHISVLCALIRRGSAPLKILSLKILRNMSFLPSNRTALITSIDFIFIVKMILDNGNYQERLLVVQSLWKMIANNYKTKNEIKNSSIIKKLNSCSRQLAIDGETENDLFKVLNIVNRLLDT